jgi:hypothetical protein
MAVLLGGPDQLNIKFVPALKNQLTSYIRAVHKLASRQKLASGKLILPARNMSRIRHGYINICDQVWQTKITDLSQVHFESHPLR